MPAHLSVGCVLKEVISKEPGLFLTADVILEPRTGLDYHITVSLLFCLFVFAKTVFLPNVYAKNPSHWLCQVAPSVFRTETFIFGFNKKTVF